MLPLILRDFANASLETYLVNFVRDFQRFYLVACNDASAWSSESRCVGIEVYASKLNKMSQDTHDPGCSLVRQDTRWPIQAQHLVVCNQRPRYVQKLAFRSR